MTAFQGGLRRFYLLTGATEAQALAQTLGSASEEGASFVPMRYGTGGALTWGEGTSPSGEDAVHIERGSSTGGPYLRLYDPEAPGLMAFAFSTIVDYSGVEGTLAYSDNCRVYVNDGAIKLYWYYAGGGTGLTVGDTADITDGQVHSVVFGRVTNSATGQYSLGLWVDGVRAGLINLNSYASDEPVQMKEMLFGCYEDQFSTSGFDYDDFWTGSLSNLALFSSPLVPGASDDVPFLTEQDVDTFAEAYSAGVQATSTATTGEAVTMLATIAGVPEQYQTISDGRSVCRPTYVGGGSALAALSKIAVRTELGALVADGAGRLVFLDREDRYLRVLVPNDALVNPSLWDEIDADTYANPQPAPTSTGGALVVTWATAPTEDRATAYMAIADTHLPFEPMVGHTYRLELTVSAATGAEDWRATVGTYEWGVPSTWTPSSSSWVTPDGTNQTASVDWLYEADLTTPSIGIEVTKPTGGWSAGAGTHTIMTMTFRDLSIPSVSFSEMTLPPDVVYNDQLLSEHGTIADVSFPDGEARLDPIEDPERPQYVASLDTAAWDYAAAVEIAAARINEVWPVEPMIEQFSVDLLQTGRWDLLDVGPGDSLVITDVPGQFAGADGRLVSRQACLIEGLRYAISASQWALTFDVTPATKYQPIVVGLPYSETSPPTLTL